MVDSMRTPADALRLHLTRSGLTQRALAQGASMTEARLSSILSGRGLPREVEARRLEAACGGEVTAEAWELEREARRAQRGWPARQYKPLLMRLEPPALEQLHALARRMRTRQADLLREAVADLLRKYSAELGGDEERA